MEADEGAQIQPSLLSYRVTLGRCLSVSVPVSRLRSKAWVQCGLGDCEGKGNPEQNGGLYILLVGSVGWSRRPRTAVTGLILSPPRLLCT